MKSKLLLAALVAATPMAVVAAPSALGTFVPDQVILSGDGVYIHGGITYPNPENCGSNTYAKFVAASPAELERIYSMLLTSIASGKSVTIWINGCTSSVWGYTVPLAYHAALHR